MCVMIHIVELHDKAMIKSHYTFNGLTIIVTKHMYVVHVWRRRLPYLIVFSISEVGCGFEANTFDYIEPSILKLCLLCTLFVNYSF